MVILNNYIAVLLFQTSLSVHYFITVPSLVSPSHVSLCRLQSVTPNTDSHHCGCYSWTGCHLLDDALLHRFCLCDVQLITCKIAR